MASSQSNWRSGDDLEVLARGAVARGADGLAMAGGDGSQAIVAAVAAEFGLPYACVPAGTRNHFALDLGVDRDDVVGALEAFVDGGERWVDLGEVNGRVFVNNVSLGLYAEAVQREGYRDAKIRTLLNTVPEVLGASGGEPDLRWRGPGDHEHRGGVAILVSNNRYRLGRALASGTRPRIDDGLLGITVIGPISWRDDEGRSLQRPWREWSAPTFRVDSERSVAAGIDGEALVLEAPLDFRIRPGVLRVRVARKHPGASPSAILPEGMRAGAVRSWHESRSGEIRNAQGQPKEANMDLMEVRERERVHREGVACRLHARARRWAHPQQRDRVSTARPGRQGARAR